MMGKQMT